MHDVHAVAEPKQLAQFASHAAHVLGESAYSFIAHWKSHVPVVALSSPPAVHAVQLVGLESVHSAHVASHASHTPPASALPAGQAATQAPSS